MKTTFAITEKFEILGRGTVVVIDDVTERVLGKEYKVQITGVNGKKITTNAIKELLLRRSPIPNEKEVYMLKGLNESEMSENTAMSFI